MVERVVVVRLKSGLLARPAALFVQEANRFRADTFVEKEGKSVNAKSIMGIMSLAIAGGQEITIRANGTDEEDALVRLVAMITRDDVS